MKKFLEKKWLALAYGFLVIAVGALTIAYAIIDPSVVTTVMSISIAVSLFILGAANIALALVAHTTEFFQKSLLVGSATIAVGVLLCVNRTLIGEFIALLLGVFFIAFAVVALIIILQIKRKKQGKSSCGCGCSNCAMHDKCHTK